MSRRRRARRASKYVLSTPADGTRRLFNILIHEHLQLHCNNCKFWKIGLYVLRHAQFLVQLSVRYAFGKAQLSARNQMTQIESEFLEKVFLSVLDDLRHFIEF